MFSKYLTNIFLLCISFEYSFGQVQLVYSPKWIDYDDLKDVELNITPSQLEELIEEPISISKYLTENGEITKYEYFYRSKLYITKKRIKSLYIESRPTNIKESGDEFISKNWSDPVILTFTFIDNKLVKWTSGQMSDFQLNDE